MEKSNAKEIKVKKEKDSLRIPRKIFLIFFCCLLAFLTCRAAMGIITLNEEEKLAPEPVTISLPQFNGTVYEQEMKFEPEGKIIPKKFKEAITWGNDAILTYDILLDQSSGEKEKAIIQITRKDPADRSALQYASEIINFNSQVWEIGKIQFKDEEIIIHPGINKNGLNTKIFGTILFLVLTLSFVFITIKNWKKL